MLRKMKMTGIAALSLCALTLPLTAKANLTIDNHSSFDSTIKLNGQRSCSNEIPKYGVTKAGTKNPIPEKLINWLCKGHENSCKAEVYMSNNCAGPIIATVIFDINKGMQNVVMTPYAQAEGFNIPYPTSTPFYIDIFGP